MDTASVSWRSVSVISLELSFSFLGLGRFFGGEREDLGDGYLGLLTLLLLFGGMGSIETSNLGESRTSVEGECINFVKFSKSGEL